MTDIDLANRALGKLGQDRIVALDNTINSKAIATVNLFLASTKREVLRARDWNCARGRAAPTLLPTDRSMGEWDYSYRLPSDFLCFRRFISVDPAIAGAAYSIEIDSENKKTLLCDIQGAQIVYTRDITDVNRWDDLMFSACVAKLAWHLSGAMVRDFKMQQGWMAQFQAEFDEAIGVDEAEAPLEVQTDSTLIDVRL
jgi:hypothetical protein